MGLEQFMGDFEDRSESQPNEKGSTEDDKEEQDKYKYQGDEDLKDVSASDVENALKDAGAEFRKRSHPEKGISFSVRSMDGGYFMVVTHPDKYADRDCILVTAIDSDTQYRVIDPYPVYMVEGWEDELLEAVEKVKENQDELIYCDECGDVMIIKTTNVSKKKIRGCSNYPDCRNKEKL